jgi:hypothetical protein
VTLPPECAVSFLGDYSRSTKKSLEKRLREDKKTASASKKMARNLAFFAQLLRENNIPRQEKGAT